MSEIQFGLALSGGGFRATLYHLGVIRFLRDAELLNNVSHITSVSGGSVLAAHLVLNWERYCGSSEQFDAAAQEVLHFASLDIRNRIIRRYPLLTSFALASRLALQPPSRRFTRTGLLENYYQRYLLGDACLHELPASPEVHLLCTNVGEGGLCSFNRKGLLMQKRSSDGSQELKLHSAGLVKVATAVAASSAFPAFFPPMALRAEDVGAPEGEFATQYFTDGGVYDNLGVRMFHYLLGESRDTIRPEDFDDLQTAIRVWKDAQDRSPRTPLARIVELCDQLPSVGAAAASRSAALTEGLTIRPLDPEAQRLVTQLNRLLAEAPLEQDAVLRRLMASENSGQSVENQDSRAAADPRVDWLFERIAELEPIDRSLALLVLEGVSYQEMSQTLGISESNVGVRIHRIKHKLAQQLPQEK